MSYASRMLEDSGATVTVDNATALTNEAFNFLPQDHATPRNRERRVVEMVNLWLTISVTTAQIASNA